MTPERVEQKRAYMRDRRRANPSLYYAREQACRAQLVAVSVDGASYGLTRGRIHRLRHEYGLTAEDYVRLYLKAGGACQLCDKPLNVNALKKGCDESAVVDHCHKTGAIRGILCQTCNRRVGYLESIDLARALKYLGEAT